MTESPWFTRAEGAEYLRISPETLDQYLKLGTIRKRTIKGTRTVRLHRDDLDAALQDPAETLSVERNMAQ